MYLQCGAWNLLDKIVENKIKFNNGNQRYVLKYKLYFNVYIEDENYSNMSKGTSYYIRKIDYRNKIKRRWGRN